MAEFAETAALLAALEEDDEELERLVKEMFASERLALTVALVKCISRLNHRCMSCDSFIPHILDQPLDVDDRVCGAWVEADPDTL